MTLIDGRPHWAVVEQAGVPEPMVDDASVLEASRAEPELFAVIFDRHAGAIKRYVARRLGDDPAEDVVSETFAAAFSQRHAYDTSRGDARPWLLGIATNMIGRHRRREIKQYRVLGKTGVDPAGTFTEEADDRVAAHAQRMALGRALAKLNRGCRDALLLVAWAELTYEEAAASLNVPVGTIRSRINRARIRLRQELGEANPAGQPSAEGTTNG